MSSKKLILSGIPASGGLAEGTACLFNSGDDSSNFIAGSILITTITDPTMITAMMKAAAIVTDIGGITSHPAIISREMGIPCVVNTKSATAAIKNGSRLLIDGTKGEIYELD